jgi:hypothetical protein
MRQSLTIFHKRTRGADPTRLTLFWILLFAGVSVSLLGSSQFASSGSVRSAKSRVVYSERQLGRRLDAQAAAVARAVAPAPAPLLPIDVDRTDDVASANLCTAAANDCSLRGAVTFANTVPGTTINLPAGTYSLTISGAGEGFSGNNAIGDLDIRGNNTSIVGAGAGATTIQQTVTARVIEVNPFLVAAFNFSISGVTLSGGQENAGVGGGAIISGSVNNTTTVTDCVISGNSATGGGTFGGGGICNTGGNLNISGTTFSGNSTSGSGGAISYSAGDLLGRASVGSMTVTSSSFSSNTAQSVAAGGGAIDIFNFNLATTSAQISTTGFVGNNAANGRGGAVIVESGSANIQYSRLVGNTAASGGRTVHRVSGTLTADNNWWGINTGPTVNANSGGIILTWLQLRAVADSTSACSGATVNVSADIYGTSAGPAVLNCPGGSCPLNGLPSFAGTVGSTSTQYVNGAATGSFVAGTGSPTATADSETVTDPNFTLNADTTATTPSDQSVCPGATASFSTTAGGTGPFNYAWTLDGSPFNGDSASINVPTGSLSTGAHPISVTVTGACGSVVRNATLTVQETASTTDPADQTVCQGAMANFSTTASGTGPFHYAWTLDGSPYDGDSASISVDTTSLSAGNHTVSVTTTGACGSDSQSATLTVQATTSTTDPADQTVCQGATATFSTTASGTGPFSYAWTVDGSPFGGNTSSIGVDTTSLSVGSHTVSVTTTGACGNASQDATLTVQATTSTTDPTDQTVCQGAMANFSTTASGTGPFHYAWTVDGSPQGGDTSSISVDTTSLSVGNHTVSVTTTGACGSASQSATLTVNAPTTTTDPPDQTVCQGATATFSTTAGGTGPFQYAWTLDGVPFNGDSPTINIPTGSLSQGPHTVTVNTTGSCGSASQTAILTVANGTPTITVGTSTISVWPPNHQYQTFNISDFNVTASSCGNVDITSSIVIVSVTSDELDDNPAGADGSTINDMVISGNCKSVDLRRERDGDLNGRVYTITFRATDSFGNTATATATVTVPINQGGSGAVGGPALNTVNGTCP